MRPANFLIFRIVQLAAIAHQNQNLWSLFLTSKKLNSLVKELQIPPSLYWEMHYRFRRQTT